MSRHKTHAVQGRQRTLLGTQNKPIRPLGAKNQFKEKKMNDQQVIDQLLSVCQQRVLLRGDQEIADLDSTDNLDSFLMALFQLNQESVCNVESPKLVKVHLATGDRTQPCRDILSALVQMQYKESMLGDAVEFFQDSI